MTPADGTYSPGIAVGEAIPSCLAKAAEKITPTPAPKYEPGTYTPNRLHSPRLRARNLKALDGYVRLQRVAAERLGGAEGEARLRRAVAHVQSLVPAVIEGEWNRQLAGLTVIDLSNAIAELNQPLATTAKTEAA